MGDRCLVLAACAQGRAREIATVLVNVLYMRLCLGWVLGRLAVPYVEEAVNETGVLLVDYMCMKCFRRGRS